MFCLSQFCCFCLRLNVKLKLLKEISCSDVPVASMAKAVLPEMRFSDINNAYSICDDCIVCLAETYTFRKRCIENNAAMMGLIERLQSAGLDVMQIKARIVRSMKHGKPTALTCKNVVRFNEAIAKAGAEFAESVEERGTVSGGETGANAETNYHRVDVKAFVEPQDSSETDIDTSVRIKRENDHPERPSSAKICETVAFFKIEPSDVPVNVDTLSRSGSAFLPHDCSTQLDPLGGIPGEKTVRTTVRKLHKCSNCGKTLHCKSLLVKHAKICKRRSERYKCESCNESYDQWDELRTHRCTSARIHGCRVCGKCFRSPSELRRHRSIHEKKILILTGPNGIGS